jgi:thiamine-phosphate pyrophosphorylase
MLVLISHPDYFAGESRLINALLSAHPSIRFHLRKPGSGVKRYETLLTRIETVHHPRVVIHQHQALKDRYTLKGVHLTSADRNEQAVPDNVVSTSFHAAEEADSLTEAYDYFFCSPVFQSISKPGYVRAERWDISGQNAAFREKAVALGGITAKNIPEAAALGFRHFAVLGAVWNAEDPLTALREIASEAEKQPGISF